MSDLKDLKVVFFGTPEFASHILEHIVENGAMVVAAVTTPDKQQGRGLKVRSSAVATKARELGIPVLTPPSMKDADFPQQLSALDADVFLVVAFKILPRAVYTIPKLGSFNVHASLLPKYRGAAPINWAIIRGEVETGITTFLLADKVDTGTMLLREAIPIGPEETAGELHDRLMHLGAQLALDTLRGLASGSITPIAQENTEATTAPKIFAANVMIDFNRSAEEVHNFIRGMSPHPGSVMIWPDGSRMKILRATVAPDLSRLVAGELQVSADRKHLFVGTATEPLGILELQLEGRKAMDTEAFLRGDRTSQPSNN